MHIQNPKAKQNFTHANNKQKKLYHSSILFDYQFEHKNLPLVYF